MDKINKTVENKSSTWEKLKPKIVEILITAILSALIAFLQSLITQFYEITPHLPTVETAGVLGAGIRAVAIATKRSIC